MYIYGKNVAKEALLNKEKIERIYLYDNFKDNYLEELINKSNIPVTYKNKFDLEKLVKGNHQGIVLKVKDFDYVSIRELENKEFLVILDHLEDPHNFGAIIRTCEAAGVEGIIIPKDRSVDVNGTVMKVSVGTAEAVKIAQVTNLVTTIENLKKQGFWIIGTDMEGTDYHDIDYNGKIAIVIGNEGKGMSKLVTKSCDFIATIPMKGKVNSLNASVAAAITIFEATNKRK